MQGSLGDFGLLIADLPISDCSFLIGLELARSQASPAKVSEV
jgi:hypothetical protein